LGIKEGLIKIEGFKKGGGSSNNKFSVEKVFRLNCIKYGGKKEVVRYSSWFKRWTEEEALDGVVVKSDERIYQRCNGVAMKISKNKSKEDRLVAV
jgi:hypothetical protein